MAQVPVLRIVNGGLVQRKLYVWMAFAGLLEKMWAAVRGRVLGDNFMAGASVCGACYRCAVWGFVGGFDVFIRFFVFGVCPHVGQYVVRSIVKGLRFVSSSANVWGTWSLACELVFVDGGRCLLEC